MPLERGKILGFPYENRASITGLIEVFGLLFKCLEFSPDFGIALDHLFRHEIRPNCRSWDTEFEQIF